jgi:hypothetical protein
MDSAGSGLGEVAGSCEHCNESSESEDGGKFTEQLSEHQSLNPLKPKLV